MQHIIKVFFFCYFLSYRCRIGKRGAGSSYAMQVSTSVLSLFACSFYPATYCSCKACLRALCALRSRFWATLVLVIPCCLQPFFTTSTTLPTTIITHNNMATATHDPLPLRATLWQRAKDTWHRACARCASTLSSLCCSAAHRPPTSSVPGFAGVPAADESPTFLLLERCADQQAAALRAMPGFWRPAPAGAEGNLAERRGRGAMRVGVMGT